MKDAPQLRGLAALTGRVHLAARLQRKAAPDFTFLTSDWQEIEVPLALTDAALALFAYASFGTPMDSLVELERRIERLIPSYIEPRLQQTTREALLDVPGVLAFPERGLRPVHRPKAGGNYRLEMQYLLAKGDTAGVERIFAELAELRRGDRPGEVAFDGTYHEAWLLLALGDTAAGIQLLDLSLNALPTMSSYLLDQLPQVATLIRGMALRAELAARQRDSATAKQWAGRVSLLWDGADPELRSTLQRMRTIAGQNP
jgi:hypothetical protein